MKNESIQTLSLIRQRRTSNLLGILGAALLILMLLSIPLWA